MKEQTILEFAKMKMKKIDWFKKKVDSNELTTDEMLKYNDLKRNQNLFSLKIFIYPLYVLFWAGIYSIVYNVAFGIDFSSVFLVIIAIVGKYWLHAITIFLVVIELPNTIFVNRYNRRLIEKIIKERRSKK
jgi:hypothetical protein